MPGSGEPQDAASTRRPERAARYIREKGVSVSGLKEPGKDARLFPPGAQITILNGWQNPPDPLHWGWRWPSVDTPHGWAGRRAVAGKRQTTRGVGR